VDSPLALDGLNRPTLRGSSLAGAMIATLRRLRRSESPQRSESPSIPVTISGGTNGRYPSVWRFFNSHPHAFSQTVVRQHVAIDARTGAAATGMLFDVETLPPATRWPFMLEVETDRDTLAADLAREVLRHWAAGRCLLGREVARGMGWLRLDDCQEYRLTTEHAQDWPCAQQAERYPHYIKEKFSKLATSVEPASDPMPGWCEISGTLTAGEYKPSWCQDIEPDACYGWDSLSIGGHASDELFAAWSDDFIAPDGMADPGQHFDPDCTVVTFRECGEDWQVNEQRPYIPGSSLRGPLRHALTRFLGAQGESSNLPQALFGTTEQGAKLLIRDAFPEPNADLRLAWFQHHAEDEFAGGAYDSAKFDRVAVMKGCFVWKMILEDASETEREALRDLLTKLAQNNHIGIGGGQWRGHGWLQWQVNDFKENMS